MNLLLDARAIFDAALAAVAPGPAVERALAGRTPARRTHLLAVGKAAPEMARASAARLAAAGSDPAGALIVSADPAPAVPGVKMVRGDHPRPGPRSMAAADAVGALVRGVRPDDEVWVLLSGGATSLIAAPREGLDPVAVEAELERLWGAGLAIHELNARRRELLRWTDGRLAEALAPARVTCLAISDVPGDDLADIGSGPCFPMAREQWLPHVEGEVIMSNMLALQAASSKASELGYEVSHEVHRLAGEASEAGFHMARVIGELPADRAGCVLAGGETVVELGVAPGLGGRSQELALAAARELSGQDGVALLAGGTDGRDGPTDAAGAVVDGNTWTGIRRAGRSPEMDLAGHDAYPALDLVGALLRTGPTGTNVADVAIGLRRPP